MYHPLRTDQKKAAGGIGFFAEFGKFQLALYPKGARSAAHVQDFPLEAGKSLAQALRRIADQVDSAGVSGGPQ